METVNYHDYLASLMRLHLLIRDGDGDSDDADKIREDMDGPFRNLTEEQKKEAANWSCFLYEFDNWINFGVPPRNPANQF